MSEAPSPHPFADFPVIGDWSDRDKARLVADLGDEALARELSGAEPVAQTKSLFAGLGAKRRFRPWEHTAHSFGFLPAATPGGDPMPLQHAGRIPPDPSLRGAAVTIRLDKLRVADYPGGGIHRILFDFSARNALQDGGDEQLHYNATLRAAEGQEAAAVGLPIFVDLNVGDLGLAFECYTVNVGNDRSDKALDMLESDWVKSGLKLTTTAQPAIAPMSQIALGLTKAILGASRNVGVQQFRLGLDFDAAGTGARLAEGSYFAVQLPDPGAWDWSDWRWDADAGRLVHGADPAQTCPYNYILFRISRRTDAA